MTASCARCKAVFRSEDGGTRCVICGQAFCRACSLLLFPDQDMVDAGKAVCINCHAVVLDINRPAWPGRPTSA